MLRTFAIKISEGDGSNYTLPCVKQRARGNPAVQHRELSSVLCDDLGRGAGAREVQEGGGMCIHGADSLHYTAETNTTL